jgi:hypothetical protein
MIARQHDATFGLAPIFILPDDHALSHRLNDIKFNTLGSTNFRLITHDNISTPNK